MTDHYPPDEIPTKKRLAELLAQRPKPRLEIKYTPTGEIRRWVDPPEEALAKAARETKIQRIVDRLNEEKGCAKTEFNRVAEPRER